MSPELSKFLADWYQWATTGAPEGCTKEGFSRYFGLCHHAYRRSYKLADELGRCLAKEFGETSDTPFNHTIEYWQESDEGLMHINPNRLAWVRRKLAAEL